MRVAVLATGWAGFNDAACRELAARGVELQIVFASNAAETAYTDYAFTEYAADHLLWDDSTPEDRIAGAVSAFAPDVILMHSWHHRPYRRIARAAPDGTLRVLWMDNVWRNIPKQWIGRAVAPWWVRSLFHCVMVPSDRTEFFARRLGFGEEAVIRGSLSADTGLFGSEPIPGPELAERARFVACSRLVHHKGADVLADAYRAYRSATDRPWSLSVAGMGPLADRFAGIDGVTMLGFQQPTQVADLMRSASCLVVPSREEPYCVAMHEGALSALPIITTYFVGAAPMFVQDGQNGWTVPCDDVESLADAMVRVSTAEPARLGEMSQISHGLGGRISSPGWARNMHEQLERRLSDLRVSTSRDRAAGHPST